MKRKCVLILCSFIVLIAIFFPTRHARHYNFIKTEDVHKELVFLKNSKKFPYLHNCNYSDIILDNKEINIDSVFIQKKFESPDKGGQFKPKDCNALLKVAIIVPYRDRLQQLTTFLNFMHHFLQNQHLFYRIFVVTQNDSLPFNRAKMLNYGAKVAIKMGYPCLILHDVDLIPLNTGNIYACITNPRHMSSSLDKFRFNLPYLTLFGGAVAIQSAEYQKINGMSNNFYGWGGEDDNFYQRLVASNLMPDRFSPVLSRYTMLLHKQEKPNEMRWNQIYKASLNNDIDGLSSLSKNYSIQLKNLYTAVFVN